MCSGNQIPGCSSLAGVSEVNETWSFAAPQRRLPPKLERFCPLPLMCLSFQTCFPKSAPLATSYTLGNIRQLPPFVGGSRLDLQSLKEATWGQPPHLAFQIDRFRTLQIEFNPAVVSVENGEWSSLPGRHLSCLWFTSQLCAASTYSFFTALLVV